MKWNKLNRRHFLQGLGGASVALPLMPSLLSSKVFAQESANIQKNFIMVPSFNCGFRMNGSSSDLMPKTNPGNGMSGFNSNDSLGRHKIHHQTLSKLVADSPEGQISNILDSSFNPFLDSMLIMQGFTPLHRKSSHNTNLFGATYNSTVGWTEYEKMPSIDQIMASSQNFYKNRALLGRHASATNMRSDFFAKTSYAYSNPSNRSSELVPAQASNSPQTLWDKFFKGFTTSNPSGESFDKLLIDKVFEDYKSLRASSRLGSEDRQVLERHIAHLAETEKEVNFVAGACDSNSSNPGDSLSEREKLRANNSVIVAAINCGLCHSFMHFSPMIEGTISWYWHKWSHDGGYNPTNDTISNEEIYGKNHRQNQYIMQDICLDLVKKLKEANQLDNSLVVWQHAINHNHLMADLPVVCFGKAGGLLNTNMYVDYRDVSKGAGAKNAYCAYPHPQLLANLLRAMDVPPSEFEPLNIDMNTTWLKNNSGYGLGTGFAKDNYRNRNLAEAQWNGHDMSEWLPLFKKS